jgi:hypothetical protein
MRARCQACIDYTRIIKRLHTWAGLLTFINLMIYGAAGFHALLLPRPDDRPRGALTVIERPFTVPPNLTDKEVGERICAEIGLTLATPVQKEAVQRDASGTLWFDFWHANGRHQIRVLESEHKLRIEAYRGSVLDYLDEIHADTAALRSADRRMQLWTWYNEFAMWCLLGMIASGLWLWLSTRPAHRIAQLSLAAGAGIFVLLYAFTR